MREYERTASIHKHGKPLRTLYKRNESQELYKPGHRAKAWTEILAFLNKYIGSDAEAAPAG